MAQQESPFGPGTDANPRTVHASELSLGADGPADSFADIAAEGGGGGSIRIPMHYEEVPGGGKVAKIWALADGETATLESARLVVHDGDVIDGSGSVVSDGTVSIEWAPPGVSTTTVLTNTAAVNINDTPNASHTATGSEAGFVIVRNSSSTTYNIGFNTPVVNG